VKLLLDENLSHKQAAELRNLGFDALAVIEAGLGGQPDPVIRAYAVETGRVLLTLDADFGDILRFPVADTPGVIRLKVHPPTEHAIRAQILKTLAAIKDRDIAGCLVLSHKDIVRVRS
jgi:predicted nuclease of predicted toxin-antitoxin system